MSITKKTDHHPVDNLIADLRGHDIKPLQAKGDRKGQVVDNAGRFFLRSDKTVTLSDDYLPIAEWSTTDFEAFASVDDVITQLEQVKADYPTLVNEEVVMTLLKRRECDLLNLLKADGAAQELQPGKTADFAYQLMPDGSLTKIEDNPMETAVVPRIGIEFVTDYYENVYLTLTAVMPGLNVTREVVGDNCVISNKILKGMLWRVLNEKSAQ